MKIYKQEASGRTQEVDEGFNGLAFLFGLFWYAYKGMWGLAFINFFVLIIINAFFGLVGAGVYWLLVSFIANGQYEDYLVSKGWHIQKGKKKDTKLLDISKLYCKNCNQNVEPQTEWYFVPILLGSLLLGLGIGNIPVGLLIGLFVILLSADMRGKRCPICHEKNWRYEEDKNNGA